jgi:DNA repair protein RecN (Recombination protein N)
VMLGLHVVLDRPGRARTLVFDEVDAGVSGAVALAVGARLAALAARHQVLCVTHLPQVAAWASRHYHVSKRVAGGRTITEVVELDEDARVDELARMLSGRQAGAAARENAAELIAEARRTAKARGRR